MKYIKESLQTQVFKVQESYKGSNEDMKTLKIQKDRYEGQAKVLGEQLEVIQQSYDELSTKKNGETDLLSKEINQLSLRDRESRQKLQWSENEVNELKDQIRSVTNELDTRTQENDHLISLLEDQEQKMA
jgi:chromosome segregation ATPase